MLILIDPDTREITDAPARRREDGSALLIEGVPCEAVEIADSEGAKIGVGNARYRLAEDGTVEVTEVAPDTPPPTIEERLAAAEAMLLEIALGGI